MPVGSSASTTRGSWIERARHRDALLLAAGELARLVVDTLREADARQQIGARAGAPRRVRSPAMSAGIMTFSSAVKSGKRWWNWKMKPISRLRKCASS